ncbi:hypothetical protein J437_LFUL007894 [Ladona fulva]|uniref:Cytochrome P450 n=1 Tax=Ladona fulva TaxID=123851 RepID=A0A8K0K779_LADFU|nr:hypothetical protein J437_LFUL007894 [Ladona fulva]
MLPEIPPWMLWPMTLLALVFGLVYLYVTWNFNYWKKRGVPTAKPTFPFGNFSEIFTISQPSQDFYRDIYDRFKGQRYAGCVTFNEVILIPRDPELIKSIMVKDFSHFHDRGMLSSEDYDSMSMNLFNLNGRPWNVLRNKLSPTFTSGKMKGMFPLIRKCTDELRHTILRDMDKSGNEIEFKDLLARYTTDAIASVAFGVEGGSLSDPNAEFRTYGRRVFDLSFPNNLRMATVLIVPYLCARLGIKTFDPSPVKYFTRMVHQTMAYREKNGVKRQDFLQLLMGLRKDEQSQDGKKAIEGLLTRPVVYLFLYFE